MIPSLFLSHGSPYLAITTNEYTNFLNELGNSYCPKAIVIFSAHFECKVLSITYTNEILDTLYDYYGFPKEMYNVKYPVKGSIEISEILERRFNYNGINTRREISRGLDHGSWVILKHMYPYANIPVVQLSVNPSLSINEQLKIGKALIGLNEDEIMIIGSGTTVHNLRWLFPDNTSPKPEAISFDDWLIENIINKNIYNLEHYKELAPYANLAVPRAEHFVPLFNAMGSSNLREKPKIIYRSYEMGTFSNLSFQFL